jgi:hypothetical protein
VSPRDSELVHEFEGLGGQPPFVRVVSHHGVRDPHPHAQGLDSGCEGCILSVEHEAINRGASARHAKTDIVSARPASAARAQIA